MAPISFARGAPSPECLDPELIADCAARGARAGRRDDPLLRHRRRLRPAARGARRAARCRSRARLPTTGGLQGFVFYAAVQLARRPGRVLVEAPTYDRPLKILALAGRRRRRAPDGRRGARPRRARSRARAAAATCRSSTRSRRSRTRAAARSATERRRRLVELSAEHDLPMLEDDPYGLVRYDGEPAPVDPRARGRRAGHVHVVVLEDGRAGPTDRLVRRAGGDARRLRRPRGLDVHLAAPPAAGDRARADRAWCVRAEPRSHPRAPGRPARRDARRRSSPRWPGALRGARPRAATSSGSSSRREPTRRRCSGVRPRRA